MEKKRTLNIFFSKIKCMKLEELETQSFVLFKVNVRNVNYSNSLRMLWSWLAVSFCLDGGQLWHDDWDSESDTYMALHPRWMISGLSEEQKNSCLQVPRHTLKIKCWLRCYACFSASHYNNKKQQMSLSEGRNNRSGCRTAPELSLSVGTQPNSNARFS